MYKLSRHVKKRFRSPLIVYIVAYSVYLPPWAAYAASKILRPAGTNNISSR